MILSQSFRKSVITFVVRKLADLRNADFNFDLHAALYLSTFRPPDLREMFTQIQQKFQSGSIF